MYIDLESEMNPSFVVPKLGFGTWQLKGQTCREAVRDALEIGYRHIDTAQAYENEEQVGQGLADSGLSRDEVFLTTKVWNDKITREQILLSVEASLRALGTDHVDLLLIHWPVEEQRPLKVAIEAITQALEAGQTRAIGVSNFTPIQFRQAVDYGPIRCHQVEYHPLLGQQKLIELCVEHDAVLTAYSPLAQGHKDLLKAPEILQIARDHAKTPHQVVLRWLLQQPAVCAIPRSSSSAHRRSNFEALGFELTGEEMETIFGLDKQQRIVNPSFGPAQWRTGA